MNIQMREKKRRSPLGNLGNSDAISALQQALDDCDREVTIQAQRAIEKITLSNRLVR
ncbi:MAG: hypothetical protein CLLPBCKN_003051 [Chroococcidiopsis cubana SAG 39.79]|nr:hypothetical protein [Chroococcidiopsis cubana]MDZ4873655.1 hypothetical protein [Chroococcidiopsis cubana SAG 39.79]